MNKRQNMLDRAARRWEIDRKLAESMKKDAESRPSKAPVITISREMGSGGATIGKMIAAELDFEYYDRAILERIAVQTDSDARHLEQHESGTRNAFGSILLSFMDRRNLQDTVYLRSLLKVVRDVGKEGHAVIIGRGGACVLPDALHIRFIAPFDVRVERMAKVRSVSKDEARQLVLEADHAQERFLRDFFGCEPNDPHRYDLVIDTAHLSLEHGAELVLMRLRQTWKEGT
jgi:cytidylate kinase